MKCAPNSFLTGCNAIACGTRRLRWIWRLSLELCGEGGGKCCNRTGIPPMMVTGHLCVMAPTSEVWPKLLKGGGNGFALVLLSLSWWMMPEKDETRKTTESSSAFEDVEWVLHRMVQLLHDQCEQALGGDQHKQSQGVQEQRDNGGEGEDNANTRPKKR